MFVFSPLDCVLFTLQMKDVISIKIPMIFFLEIENPILKLIWNLKGPQRAKMISKSKHRVDFSGGSVVKNPPAKAGDTGSIPGSERVHMPWGN